MLSSSLQTKPMRQSSSATKWISVGYNLFTEDAHEGIQVERLARILGLNKSGFYYYFKDLDTYMLELMHCHLARAEAIEKELVLINKFDPDFIQLLVKHSDFLLFQMQLIKNRKIKLYETTFTKITRRYNLLILPHWASYIGLSKNKELALEYFEIIREMFYMRLNAKKCDFEFFSTITKEAKEIVSKLIQQKKLN